MWKPALFFITIIAVTPSGRAAVGEVADEAMAQLAAQAPYSYVTLAFLALISLICLLMMRGWRAKKQEVYVVWREIRYEPEIRMQPRAPIRRRQPPTPARRSWLAALLHRPTLSAFWR